jgi:hypothetical protein
MKSHQRVRLVGYSISGLIGRVLLLASLSLMVMCPSIRLQVLERQKETLNLNLPVLCNVERIPSPLRQSFINERGSYYDTQSQKQNTQLKKHPSL